MNNIYKPKKIKWNSNIFQSNAIYDGGHLFERSVSLEERIRRGEIIEVTNGD